MADNNSTTFENLQKLLVNVSEGNTDAFKSKYYRKDHSDEDDRSDKYDNKVVFLHDSHEIFTHNELFGSMPTVGTSNSITVGDTKYILNINNGELTIDPYIKHSCTVLSLSGGADANAATEYGVEASATAKGATKYSATIYCGTENVLVTGISVNNSYVYGGEATVSGGVATVANPVTSTPTWSANYVKGNAASTVNAFNQSNVTLSAGTVADVTATSSTTTKDTQKTALQTIKVYVHVKGEESVHECFSATKQYTATAVANQYGFYSWSDSAYKFEDTALAGKTLGTSLQSPFTTYPETGKYFWMAVKKSYGATETATVLVEEKAKNKNLGTAFVWADNENYVNATAWAYMGTTQVNDIDYLVYRSQNHSLESNKYYIKKA